MGDEKKNDFATAWSAADNGLMALLRKHFLGTLNSASQHQALVPTHEASGGFPAELIEEFGLTPHEDIEFPVELSEELSGDLKQIMWESSAEWQAVWM